METSLDCIPCFFSQLLAGARIAGAPPEIQKRVLDEFACMLPGIPLDAPPPEIARMGYSILNKTGLNGDLYKEIKRESNRLALSVYAELKERAFNSEDRLLAAAELAIAGNIIDFGAKRDIDIKKELQRIVSGGKKSIRGKQVFDFEEFKNALDEAENILYLADNAGEAVFDRVLLEVIKDLYPAKELLYAVKEKPVINDALAEDAVDCGIGSSARIISNGSDAPGTVLRLCSEEFREIYLHADAVISKGQGNFETLSAEKKLIFFLFLVKCPAVANETGCEEGDAVLLCNLKNGNS
jgi:damage-control phosphatase, subfamily I